jgi:hypothetical protein
VFLSLHLPSFQEFPNDSQSLFVWVRILPDLLAVNANVQFRVEEAILREQYGAPSSVPQAVRVGMSEWDITDIHVEHAHPHESVSTAVTDVEGGLEVSQCGFTLSVQRIPEYYRKNVVVPIIILNIISFLGALF